MENEGLMEKDGRWKRGERKPVMEVLRGMDVGEEEAWPVERMNTVRTSCTLYGLTWGRRFTTWVKRDERMLVVRRVE